MPIAFSTPLPRLQPIQRLHIAPQRLGYLTPRAFGARHSCRPPKPGAHPLLYGWLRSCSVQYAVWQTFIKTVLNAVVTCGIKSFRNYFSLRRRPSEIISFERVEACLKLFQNYFGGLLQLMNILNKMAISQTNQIN